MKILPIILLFSACAVAQSTGAAGEINLTNAQFGNADMYNITIKDNLGIGSPKDGVSLGLTTINAVFAQLDSTNSWCVQGNVWSTGDMAGQHNAAPNTTSPGCPTITTPNQTVTTQNQMGFALYNGANGGDYHLCHGAGNPAPTCTTASPFVGAASDGTDPGADITAVNAAIAGVN